MTTPEDFLRQDVGALLASLLFQIAMLKAENARLSADRPGPPAPDVASRGAP